MSLHRASTWFVVLTVLTLAAPTVRGDAYSDAVQALNPTHYYRLDETTIGTVTDIGSAPIHGQHEGNGLAAPDEVPLLGEITGYPGVPGPNAVYKYNPETMELTTIPLPGFDASNRALFTNNGLAVNLGPALGPQGENWFAHTTMTVATWFKVPNVDALGEPNPGVQETQFGVSTGGGDRLWTNNFPSQDLPTDSLLNTSDVDDLGHLQIDLGAGANLVISIDDRFSEPLKSNYQIPHRDNHPGPFGPAGEGSGLAVKDGSWHHIVVSRNGDDIMNTIVVVDGELITTDRYADSTDSWGITEPFDARIGTRTTAPHDQTFNGWIDEMAIWIGRALTVDEAISMWNAAAGLTPSLGGDFDADGDVDGNDFLVWQQGVGSTYDAGDLADWKANYGAGPGLSAVPEPSSLALSAAALVAAACSRRRRKS